MSEQNDDQKRVTALTRERAWEMLTRYNNDEFHLRHAETEEVHLALLDVKCCLLRHEQLSKGTLRSSPVSPREVFETALRCRAASFILLHNHPSGNCTPSKEDFEVTNTLRSLGQSMQLPMLDHIIIGDPGYYSFKDSGVL